MVKILQVDFTGWLSIPINKITFLHMETLEEINGLEWEKLSEDDQCDYILEDLCALMRDSDVLEWDDITYDQPIDQKCPD
jgi:hypothetical protein